VSDPFSPKFNDPLKFKSADELLSWVSPTSDDVAILKRFLLANRVESRQLVALRDDVFELRKLTMKQVKSLFDVELQLYRHEQSGATMWRADRHYSLPAHVAPLVDFVAGLLTFPNMEKLSLLSAKGPNPAPPRL
jgi:hypothetical protein